VKYVTHHHVYLLNINSCAILQTRNAQLRIDIEKSSLVVETEGPIRPIAASGISLPDCGARSDQYRVSDVALPACRAGRTAADYPLREWMWRATRSIGARLVRRWRGKWVWRLPGECMEKPLED
jgi:hypothetical protein